MTLKFPVSAKGEYVRPASSFRNFITEDGSSGFPPVAGRYHLYVAMACPWANRTLIGRALKGLDDVISVTAVHYLLTKDGWHFAKPDGSSGFPPVAGRYHLYVAMACPWANRTLIGRALKGLDDVISVTAVHYLLTKDGWHFAKPDPINGKTLLRDIYLLADPEFNGRVTVPVLWDKEKKTIVNNESSEILRMLGSAFNGLCKTPEQKAISFYPSDLQTEIDSVNEWIYPMINNGVYRSGFATSQDAYDTAVREVFEGLDRVEVILAKRRYMVGDRFTEADIRLFTTLIRFDLVYAGHFKCNKRRIVDYPNIWAYTREIYQMAGIAATVDFQEILKHYMASHTSINPTAIVAIQPEIDNMAPHGREALSEAN